MVTVILKTAGVKNVSLGFTKFSDMSFIFFPF